MPLKIVINQWFSFQNRFLTLDACSAACESPLVEKEILEDENSGSSAATVAETVLGVVLCLLAVVAVGLGIKYYK